MIPAACGLSWMHAAYVVDIEWGPPWPRITSLIAGVSVPDSPLITDVLEYAEKLSELYLFNHAVRSWLFAELGK